MDEVTPAAKRPRLDAVARTLGSSLLANDWVRSIAAIDELADDALALAAAAGVVMYREPAAKVHATVVPITLLPTPVPSDMYRQAEAMAPDFHKLMDSIALDLPWLKMALEGTGKLDAICGGLLRICDVVYGPGKKDLARDIRLHIMRNDFMLDTRPEAENLAMRQIELNMIAASFSAHAQDLSDVHRYLLVKYAHRLDSSLTSEVVSQALDEMIPRSNNIQGIAAALAQAHFAYVKRWTCTGKSKVVLVVAEVSENNEMDQRKLEAALFRGHRITCLRRSIAQLGAQLPTLLSATLTAASGCNIEHSTPQALIVDGHEVTVAYFRSGYWPAQFADSGWAAREAVEVSEAVKCPSAPAQLAGMKKVQQLLCEPEQLRRFVGDETAGRLERAFARQSDPSSSSEDAKACVKNARDEPAKWVMKPQVEGSGDLYFDADIPRVLDSRKQEELSEFILMERIRPPVTPSVVFRAQEGKRAEVIVRPSVAELGIFGTFVADAGKTLTNEAIGYLLRSKAKQTNQGGVFVGNAVVDVPLLLPADVFWPAVSS